MRHAFISHNAHFCIIKLSYYDKGLLKVILINQLHHHSKDEYYSHEHTTEVEH